MSKNTSEAISVEEMKANMQKVQDMTASMLGKSKQPKKKPLKSAKNNVLKSEYEIHADGKTFVVDEDGYLKGNKSFVDDIQKDEVFESEVVNNSRVYENTGSATISNEFSSFVFEYVNCSEDDSGNVIFFVQRGTFGLKNKVPTIYKLNCLELGNKGSPLNDAEGEFLYMGSPIYLKFIDLDMVIFVKSV